LIGYLYVNNKIDKCKKAPLIDKAQI